MPNSVLPPLSVLAPSAVKLINGSAASSNVTGEATATGTLDTLAQGLSTGIDSSDFGTVINSDGTIQGFANTSLAATADTTDGKSSATADGKAVDGASLGDLDIGGVGTVVSANSLLLLMLPTSPAVSHHLCSSRSVDGLDFSVAATTAGVSTLASVWPTLL